MSGPRCPRCHREAPGPTAFCTGCGAPLLLGDEGPAAPLDVALDLDRRSRAPGRPRGDAPAPAADLPGAGAPPPLPRGLGPRAGELAEVERSHWDLGPIVASAGATAREAPTPIPTVRPKPAPIPIVRSEPTTITTATRTPTATATPTPTATKAATPITTANATPTANTNVNAQPLDDVPEPEVDALEVHVARAEPWRRAVAWAVDGIPFVAAGGGAAFVLLREAAAARGGAPRTLLDVVDLLSAERVIALSIAAAVALALASYATLAHALGGATLGKRLVGLRVVGPDGGPPSPARSAIRSGVALLSAALLGLGFLLALFTRTGRALHDLVARTWVVKAP